MYDRIRITQYVPGEAPQLFAVFRSAVHGMAGHDYTAAQLNAWAPSDLDPAQWERTIDRVDPFVADLDGQIVGYANLQRTGDIDHFFVHASFARRGIGTVLMRHLVSRARQQGISSLTCDVSRGAEPFFERFGFRVIEQRSPIVRGVAVPNVRMRREGASAWHR